MVELHRQTLLDAGDDPLRIIAANKLFWARKYEFLGENDSAANLLLFNEKKRGSYHPWSAFVMGEVYGELELKEFISPKDYLYTTPLVDEFLMGVVKGTEALQKRKKRLADEAARQARQGQQNSKNIVDNLTKTK